MNVHDQDRPCGVIHRLFHVILSPSPIHFVQGKLRSRVNSAKDLPAARDPSLALRMTGGDGFRVQSFASL